jgi:alkanesulfonate monooxygenase SsuD/methylene tetrahydromethanopterin reductase-like flavin-dependent oxidoreductase (luciferase family)
MQMRGPVTPKECLISAATASPHPWVAEGAHTVRFGVETTVLPDWPATRDLVQTVEGLGFDSLWLPDHPMVTGSATWTSLAAIATATRTIRLGTLVACAAYWNPVVLARAAADVDRLSGGRFVLGLGSGDMPHEFAHLGLAWPSAAERQATLEETLRIVKPLLRGQAVSDEGERPLAGGAVLEPPPVQQPYVPLLVAGGGERTTLRFVAEYADAANLGAVSWAGGTFTPADVRRKLDVLRRRCEEADRPYESVLRTGLLSVFLAESRAALDAKMANVPPFILGFFEQLPVVGTPEEAVARVRLMLDAGFQYVIFIVLPFDTESLRLLAERVLPAVASEYSTERGAASLASSSA